MLCLGMRLLTGAGPGFLDKEFKFAYVGGVGGGGGVRFDLLPIFMKLRQFGL